MHPRHDPGRRKVIGGLAAVSACVAAGISVGKGANPVSKAQAQTLVAFFSRTGNTRVVAGLIHRSTPSDLFEIQPARPYPEDYLQTVEQARRERDSGYEPALAALVKNIAGYRTVYLGFPIWGETAPPIIRAFLSNHDLAVATLIPFVTHGGYGLGSSQVVLRKHAPKAKILPGFSMQADQERQTMDRVKGWLKSS